MPKALFHVRARAVGLSPLGDGDATLLVRMLGHSSISVALDVSHLLPDM
jgi:hypothetical protein